MNDSIFHTIIAAGLGLWIALLVFQLIVIGYRRLKQWLAVRKLVQDGRIPADYGVVEREQKRLNDIDISGTDVLREKYPAERAAISCVRETCATVRYEGYLRGQDDHQEKVAFAIGVRNTPFMKGSGASKQWVRGYCMGRNVLDIKQYYNAA